MHEVGALGCEHLGQIGVRPGDGMFAREGVGAARIDVVHCGELHPRGVSPQTGHMMNSGDVPGTDDAGDK